VSTWRYAVMPAEAVVCLLTGELDAGMRQLRAAMEESAGLYSAIADLYMTVTYARAATHEVQAPAHVLVRNSRFVIRHALSARRRAEEAFARHRDDPSKRHLDGFQFILAIEQAKLDRRNHRYDDALTHLDRAIACVSAYGDGEGLRRARQMREELLEKKPRRPRRA
jgi:hypothetical protein